MNHLGTGCVEIDSHVGGYEPLGAAADAGGSVPCPHAAVRIEVLRKCLTRLDDTGQTWVRINDDQHQWGLLLHITGDPKKYGRVYVGTHGRGTMYGDPVAAKD